MSTTTTETKIPTLEEKTRELCQFILEDPVFAAAQGRIETFLENEDATELYGNWQRKASELHQKHHEGNEPSDDEIKEFEGLKAKVLDHPVAADFLEAEDTVNDMFQTITKMVQKTLQNGKIPTDEDLKECCGNSGCGCH